jgi:hypothetical protein
MITDFAPTVTFHHIFSIVPNHLASLQIYRTNFYLGSKEIGIWEKTMDEPELRTLLPSFFHMMVF